MPVKVKRMLVFLLIILKETGPTAACGDRCTSSSCNCNRFGLRSVPQFLPTTITNLYMKSNAITTLSQSDFSRYNSLTRLDLSFNQISVINSGAFYNLTSLTHLYLQDNQITSLQADMFVGLDNLQDLSLGFDNWMSPSIHSIEAGTFSTTPQLRHLGLEYHFISNIVAGTFVNLPQLRTLYLNNNQIRTIAADAFANLPQLHTLMLYHNRISTFPSDFLSNLNSSRLSSLRLEYNQMETLPAIAYDILTSISTVMINNNPLQCDCRMLPFKQNMTGFYAFEYTITCAGPAHLQGKSLLQDVNPEDLICAETTTEIPSTPSTSSPALRSTQHVHVASSTTTAPSTANFHSESSPTTAPSTTHFHSESSPTTAPSTTHFHSESSPTTAPSTTNFHSESSPKAAPSTTQFQSIVGSTASSAGSFSLPLFLSALGGVLVGAFLTSVAYSAMWCKIRRRKTTPNPIKYPRYKYARKTTPSPVLDLSVVDIDTDVTAL